MLGKIITILMASSMALAEGLPVIVVTGRGEQKKIQSAQVNIQDFSQVIYDVVSKVSSATLESVRLQSQSAGEKPWLLRNICVGLGLNFSLGLGPWWTVSAAPRIRVGFSNTTHPKIPD